MIINGYMGIQPRTKNTSFLKAAQPQCTKNRLENLKTKFLLRALRYDYTREFMENLNRILKNRKHSPSIIHYFDNSESEETQLLDKIKQLKEKKKVELT